MEKKLWKGLEELNNDPEFVRLKNNEFYEHLPLDEIAGKKLESASQTTRRDFLKYLGFGVAAASLAACETPIRKTMPYVVKPDAIVPGVPNYYATTYNDGHDYASIVVKTREGRPIKIEGNELSSINKGKINARVQASVLGVYDNGRTQKPMKNGVPAEWSLLMPEIKGKLKNAGSIRIVSSTINSPTTKKVIADFINAFPGTKHITYDAISYYGITKANELSFGKAVLPTYRFDNARVIVGISCDFLANWLSPVEYANQYAVNRKLSADTKSMSKHIQIESMLTNTGSCADKRIRINPSETGAAICSLYNKIAAKAGAASVSAGNTSAEKALDGVAEQLWNAKGNSLVVCGTNNINEQLMVNAINSLLGNYGSAINLERFSNLKQGNDAAMAELVAEMNSGAVDAVIFYNTNPVYSYYDSKAIVEGLKKTGLSISFADRKDETASLCKYLLPDSNYLESWNDAEPVKGSYSLSQPVIQKLYDTRQAQECLLAWSDAAVTNYHDYLKNNWQSLNANGAFENFWNKVLGDGVFEVEVSGGTSPVFSGNVTEAASAINTGKQQGDFEIVLYEKTGIGNGLQSNNPWLQEMPDPITKICWDNYAAISPKTAEAKGLKQGNVIEIKSGSVVQKLPVCLQPGMAENTIAVALGYGRTAAGKAANNIGKNVYGFVTFQNGSFVYTSKASISKTTDEYKLASTQTHHTMMGREIVKSTTLAEWKTNPLAGNEPTLIVGPDGKTKMKPADLDVWATDKNPGFEKVDHHWGMGIDLNACIGCGACVVACQVENNIPVVGKDEIGLAREMHWIRIDRYYSSDTTKENAAEKGLGKLSMYSEMEKPSAENPKVYFQPVMCQHCNHAPCETVCPVLATTHSMDGLNMMAYNRCVGTRYCANNCPYKVRRFNWFNYQREDLFPQNTPFHNEAERMVLNPDVVVRSRGVMEKCSMCVQRIQFGKLEAKKAGRRPKEGEITTACAQTCPTNAITFGDYLDHSGALSKMVKDDRKYYLLEELNVQPSVFYLTKIENTDQTA